MQILEQQETVQPLQQETADAALVTVPVGLVSAVPEGIRSQFELGENLQETRQTETSTRG